MDGKTVRGARNTDGSQVHLLATLADARGVVAVQTGVGRTRSGPRAMAALRNLAAGALCQAGRHNTTEATRWASRYMERPFIILGLTS